MTNTTEASGPGVITLWSPFQAQTLIGFGQNIKENTSKVFNAVLGTRVERFGWPSTIVATREWSSSDLGKVHKVVVSSDGFGIELFWCVCENLVEDDWIYYECWSAVQRSATAARAHGWACPDCRGITQVGC